VSEQEPLKAYPPPWENPACVCWPNTMKAFFCPHGHMLECHAGQTCEEARCSHLARYDDPELGDEGGER
jgi:hypothetical protein